MTKADEYRSYAEQCQQKAERVANDAEKAHWLQLAQSWMMLVCGERQITAHH